MSPRLYTNEVEEFSLTTADITNLRCNIRIYLFLSFGFTLVITVGLGVIGFIASFFITITEGFAERATYAAVGLCLPFFGMCLICLAKYIDLKRGKKLRVLSYHYEIKRLKKSDSVKLIIKDNKKRKMEISTDVADKIRPSLPIVIELAPLSKTMLSLSQRDQNLLAFDE